MVSFLFNIMFKFILKIKDFNIKYDTMMDQFRLKFLNLNLLITFLPYFKLYTLLYI